MYAKTAEHLLKRRLFRFNLGFGYSFDGMIIHIN